MKHMTLPIKGKWKYEDKLAASLIHVFIFVSILKIKPQG